MANQDVPDETILILAGSARADGNTALIAHRLADLIGRQAQLVDLNAVGIGPFVYGGALDRDDFGTIIRLMVARRRTVLVTPVYWYAMSGVMKRFFDRFTDLLGQPEGRALAGRALSCIATGTDAQTPPGFEEPFARTADYFGMEWGGITYVRSDRGAPPGEAALQPLAQVAQSLLQ